MGKLRSYRVKCRQIVSTRMASLLGSDVLYRRGTLGDQGYSRESSDPKSIVTLTHSAVHTKIVLNVADCRS